MHIGGEPGPYASVTSKGDGEVFGNTGGGHYYVGPAGRQATGSGRAARDGWQGRSSLFRDTGKDLRRGGGRLGSHSMVNVSSTNEIVGTAQSHLAYDLPAAKSEKSVRHVREQDRGILGIRV